MRGNEERTGQQGCHCDRRRSQLLRELRYLDVRQEVLAMALRDANADQLQVIEALTAQASHCGAEEGSSDWMSSAQYMRALDRLARDYVGALNASRLTEVNPTANYDLHAASAQVASVSRLMKSIEHSRRSSMWASVAQEMRSALPQVQQIVRAMNGLGITAALNAESHLVLKQLRRSAVPELDLAIQEMAGETDPEGALMGLVRAARLAPAAHLQDATAETVLTTALEKIESTVNEPSALAAEPAAQKEVPVSRASFHATPKRWTGYGKLFNGLATAGANIAGGVATATVGGPLATGITAGMVIASCGVGFGAIAEGIGALRGE